MEHFIEHMATVQAPERERIIESKRVVREREREQVRERERERKQESHREQVREQERDRKRERFSVDFNTYFIISFQKIS